MTTLVRLPISQAAFREIADALLAADYGHVFMPGGSINMDGIAVEADPARALPPNVVEIDAGQLSREAIREIYQIKIEKRPALQHERYSCRSYRFRVTRTTQLNALRRKGDMADYRWLMDLWRRELLQARAQRLAGARSGFHKLSEAAGDRLHRHSNPST